MKERFRVRIVAGPAHACTLQEPVLGDGGAERRAHILGAAITVKDQRVGRPTSMHRVGEHCARDGRGATTRERPGEDASRTLIHDDREIAPAPADAEVRDIADPHLIRARDARLPEAIGMLREARLDARLGAIAADRFRAEARRAHQPRDATTTATPARVHQLAMQSRTAIAPLMPREATTNLRGQRPVLDRVRAFFPPTPGVEPAGRDVVAATERRDGVAFVLRDEVVDEGEAFAL